LFAIALYAEDTQKVATLWLNIRKNWLPLGSAYAKIDYPMAENAKITPALIQFSGRGQELRDVWLLARVAW
jgi:hypothetical protein